MTTATKLSINKVGPQRSRPKQYADGLKRGLLNETADKLINQFANPVADKLQPILNGLHPGLQMIEDQTKSAISFGMLLALAEIVGASGKIFAKIPGVGLSEAEAVEKCEAFAEYLRTYAGEKMGVSVAELALSAVPMFIEIFQNMDRTELLTALSGQKTEVQTQVEQVEEQAQPA